MGDIFWIQHGAFITTLADSQDRLRYSIEWSTPEGHWLSTIRTVAQQRSDTGDCPDMWYDEIATIHWSFQATSVIFGRRMVKASSYLRSEGRFARYVTAIVCKN